MKSLIVFVIGVGIYVLGLFAFLGWVAVRAAAIFALLNISPVIGVLLLGGGLIFAFAGFHYSYQFFCERAAATKKLVGAVRLARAPVSRPSSLVYVKAHAVDATLAGNRRRS